MIFAPWCYTCDCTISHSRWDFADVVKVINQLTITEGDNPGLSGEPNVIARVFKRSRMQKSQDQRDSIVRRNQTSTEALKIKGAWELRNVGSVYKLVKARKWIILSVSRKEPSSADTLALVQ